MNRVKQPRELYERIINKGHKGLEQLEQYIKRLALQSSNEDISELRLSEIDAEISNVITFFTSKSKIPLNNENHRSLLVQSLESVAFELELYHGLPKYFKDLSIIILKYFRDISEKVRLTAIGSIYNLFNKYAENGLELFLTTFEAVSCLISDESGQVRQAVTFLNQTLKTMINDAVFDHKPFDLRGFIETLAEKFSFGGPLFKQFLLDWLMAIEEIPHFQLSFDLPLFFKQVFELLISDSKSLRTKAQECLKKFIHVFKEILSLGGTLWSKLHSDNAQMLIEMTIIMIRLNLSVQTTLHALEWLEVFTRFFSLEIQRQQKAFLSPIYASHFNDIILVIVNTLSDDCERVRKASQRINEALLSAFPTMEMEGNKVNQSSSLLQKLLQENRISMRVEAIMKWIILLLQHNSEQMLSDIKPLINCLVERLCDRNATRGLFLLLEGSLFVEEYFDLLVETLLLYLCQNEQIPSEPIFRQLLSLEGAQKNFLAVCHRVRIFDNGLFQYRLLQILIAILVTQRSLESLRTQIQSLDGEQLTLELFQCFCKNQSAIIMLAFLTRHYYLVIQFMKLLAYWQKLTDYKLKSLVRISNLIQHSNLNHLRTDLRKSSLPVRAYLSLLMALPHGKYHNLLLQRLPPQMKTISEQPLSKEEEFFAIKVLQQYEQADKRIVQPQIQMKL